MIYYSTEPPQQDVYLFNKMKKQNVVRGDLIYCILLSLNRSPIKTNQNMEYPKQHGCRVLLNISQSNSTTFNPLTPKIRLLILPVAATHFDIN